MKDILEHICKEWPIDKEVSDFMFAVEKPAFNNKGNLYTNWALMADPIWFMIQWQEHRDRLKGNEAYDELLKDLTRRTLRNTPVSK